MIAPFSMSEATVIDDVDSTPKGYQKTTLSENFEVEDIYPDGGFDGWMVVLADFICCFNAWGVRRTNVVVSR